MSDALNAHVDLAAVLEQIGVRAPKSRVICLGLSALDQIWSVEKFFSGDGAKIRASDFRTSGGGMAANASVTVARLGARAAFWGRGGADAAGKEMQDALAACGVDIAQFKLFEGGRSSVSGVVVEAGGDRQIVNFRGSFPDEPDWLPLEQASGAAAVLADPRWPRGAAALFEAARGNSVPTVLDADMAERDVFDLLLPLTDHAIFSAPALATFAGSADESALAKVAAYGCRVAAVTRGEAGVSWIYGGVHHRAPALPVRALDTNGAGDAFHGAYALAIGAGRAVAESMAFASLVAAYKCAWPGVRESLPTLAQCIDFQRTVT